MFYMTYYVHVISILSKSPFYHIYVTVGHNITHSTKADMLTHMFYLDKPIFTKPADYTKVPHANTNMDDNGIRHRNLWEKEAYEFGLD